MSLLDPQSEWSGLLFQTLVEAGIRDVVVSPGSRSTPFVLAAAARPTLRLHEIIDERSAAFFALGQARVTDRPSLLLCTSGTAGAHYLPAIAEASHAYLPLLVLTADRPLELQGCAAPQTIDQTKLFGDQVRAFVELGAPEEHPAALRGLRRKLVQAVHTSRWPTPGPVHLNARASKPLEPREATGDRERQFAQRARALATSPLPLAFRPRVLPAEDGLDALGNALARAQRPLFFAGPAHLSAGLGREVVSDLVARARGVLLAEAASQLRFGARHALSTFDAYLDLEPIAERLLPDLVVHLGGTPSSSAYARFLAEHPVAQWVIAPHGWNDAESAVTALFVAEPSDVARALLPRFGVGETTEWQRLWSDLETGAQRVVDQMLDATAPLTEPAAVRAVVRSLTEGDLLAVGNSLPIREVDLFCPAALADCGVLSQRGANGIDGLVSGAAGAASMGRRVTLLLGDVSFLHDLGGLWAAARATSGLRVVVLQNHGGRIFEDLPLSESGVGDAMSLFTTPHEARLDAAANIFGIAYRRAETLAELARALEGGSEGSRTCLIEAVVPPRSFTDTRRAMRTELSRALLPIARSHS